MGKIDIEIMPELQKKFGYAGLGYYLEIMSVLKIKKNHLYELDEVGKLAEDMRISKRRLNSFIDACTQIVGKDGYKLLSKNEKYFWSDRILISDSKYKNRLNSKQTGRKKLSLDDCVKFEDVENVYLTKEQLNRLNHRYGVLFIKNAIKILDKWLKRHTRRAKKYLNKNSYPQFRCDGWLIKATQELASSINYAQINTPDGVMGVYKVL